MKQISLLFLSFLFLACSPDELVKPVDPVTSSQDLKDQPVVVTIISQDSTGVTFKIKNQTGEAVNLTYRLGVKNDSLGTYKSLPGGIAKTGVLKPNHSAKVTVAGLVGPGEAYFAEILKGCCIVLFGGAVVYEENN